jgi:hypothetical protein
MKVEILRQVMISGESAAVGSILEVDRETAMALIGLGKAVEFKEEVKTEEQPSEKEAPKPKPTTRKRTKQ